MNLFVYGTLLDPEIMRLVSGKDYQRSAAVLPGYACRKLADVVYPAIMACQDVSTSGVVYTSVPLEDIFLLDRYEGNEYVRQTVAVNMSDGSQVAAETYVIAPAQSCRILEESWSFDQFKELHRAKYLRQLSHEGF